MLALYFATMLSFNTRFRNLFKGILFFPYLINGVAIAFVFLYFFQPGGTLDTVARRAAPVVDATPVARRPALVNFSLAGVSVWRYMGLNFVLFLGAIQSIPAELYEAAELDGANRWHQFRYIIVPGIRPVIGLSFILAISGSLSRVRDPVHHDRRRQRQRRRSSSRPSTRPSSSTRSGWPRRWPWCCW